MPFRVPLDVPVSALAAGEKQKLEILKQLYLEDRFLILDEPTSVLTPGEADEVLGLLRRMTREGKLTVLIITHKFREVKAFADDVTVLRRGKLAGSGGSPTSTRSDMAEMMIGAGKSRTGRRASRERPAEPRLRDRRARRRTTAGCRRSRSWTSTVKAGEIVGIAGVSGNGQRELVEMLAGQRPAASGEVFIDGEPYRATPRRDQPPPALPAAEEPLRNACVAAHDVSPRTWPSAPSTSRPSRAAAGG